MQLPEFISKALAFFQKAEANLTAEEQLTKARSDHAAALSLKDARIKELETAAGIAAGTITTQGTEIVTLKAAVETEKKKANAVIAGQGLPADATPAAEAGSAEPKGESARAKYQRLLASDPRAAGAWYAANADKIFETA